jgi:hypothetical protein
MPLAVTELFTGTDAGVEKMKLADVAVWAKTAEMTAKLYVVFGFSPVKVTECNVIGDELSAERDP